MPRLHCLNPCRRYPKCRWGLYASPPPVAMAVVGLFLLSSFFCEKKKCTRVASGKKKSIRGLHQEKKCAFFPLAFFHTRVTPKKKKLHGLHFFPNTRVAPKKKKVHGLHFFPYAGYSKKKSTRVTFFSKRGLHFQLRVLVGQGVSDHRVLPIAGAQRFQAILPPVFYRESGRHTKS